jgi:hypothetical protein
VDFVADREVGEVGCASRFNLYLKDLRVDDVVNVQILLTKTTKQAERGHMMAVVPSKCPSPLKTSQTGSLMTFPPEGRNDSTTLFDAS